MSLPHCVAVLHCFASFMAFCCVFHPVHHGEQFCFRMLILSLQITVPKEGVTVLFCPSGVRAPQRGSAMGRDGRPVAVSRVQYSVTSAICFTKQMGINHA